MANNFENPEVFMEVAKAAAGHYADSYAVKLLAFSENATYLVYDPATDEKLFVLRVGRPGYHTREEYESEISWLRQINDYTPLKVANPIPASVRKWAGAASGELSCSSVSPVKNSVAMQKYVTLSFSIS